MNYLVARVSDKDQRKALPAQRKRLFDYAAYKHWVESKDFIYIEYDETAFKGDRKRFNELVIEPLGVEKELSILVFDKIDRFSRDSSSDEKKAIMTLCRKGRIELHFPSDNLYLHMNSPANDLFRLDIGVAVAAYYSAATRDNVKRRFEQMLNDGIWVGYAPIGYMNVNLGTPEKPKKDIIIDITRAPHVIKAFEMRAVGMPYEHIAKHLNAQGMTTKSGKQLNKSLVEKMLRNKFYYGVMRYTGKPYDHKYETLIEKQLFDACQQVRSERHSSHATYNSKEYAFKEFVRCGGCGCTVSSYNSRNSIYLRCSGAKGKCGNTTMAQSLAMPAVVADIAAIPIPEGALPLVINELKSRHDNQQLYYTQNIEQTRVAYDKIKAQLKALAYERLDGRITVEVYDEIVTELTNQQQTLNKRLIALTNSNKSFLVTASYLLDLAQRAAQLFTDASPRLQKKLLKFILSNVKMFDKQLTYVMNDPYKTFVGLNKRALSGSNNTNWCG